MYRVFVILSIFVFLLDHGICQENVDRTEIPDEYEDNQNIEEPIDNGNMTEIQPQQSCSNSVRSHLRNITKELYQEEFLPELTLNMSNYMDTQIALVKLGLQFKEKLLENGEKIKSLENELGQNQGKITSLENELGQNQGKITSLENELDQSQGKITSLENELSQNIQKVSSMENTLTQLTQQINTLDLEMRNSRTPKVLFHATKTNGRSAFTGDIKFNDVTLNIGDAMDGPEGIFRAPVAGYYKFTISASSGYKRYGGVLVYVYKNGKHELSIWDGKDGSANDGINIGYTWIWHLNLEDTVKLSVDSQYDLSADRWFPVTFIGELVYVEPEH